MRVLHLVTYDYRWDTVNEGKELSTNYWELPSTHIHLPSYVKKIPSESWWIVPGTLDPRVD